MHKLYLTGLGESRLYAVKAIRESLKVFDPDAQNVLKAAVSLAETCDRKGYALVGENENPALVRVAHESLERNDYARGWVDPTDADLQELAKEPTPKTELSTIEANPTYAAAMVMLTMTEGNPLKAFAYAHSLATVSNAPEHYQEIMGSLLMTFPWIMEMAKIGGIEVDWNPDEE